MRKSVELFKIEMLLFVREFFGFFFTFVFPVLMLALFGCIYGNEPSPYFNGLGSMDVSVPAYSAMIVGVTGLMAFPLTLAAYKEKKIYKRFDATPAGKGLVITIQALVNICMTFLGFLLLFIVGRLVWQIRIQGRWPAIGAALLLSIAAVFSMGFFFTAVSPTSKISNLLCYLSYFIMIFISGATIPLAMLPDTVKSISRFLPLTHAVNILQGTFRDAPFVEYRDSVIVLAVVFAVCTVAGAALYRKKSWI